MNEAKLRQRSLLDEVSENQLPKEIEVTVFELLVELLLAVVPSKGEKRDE